MATPAETFQKASFNGIEFPIARVAVKGGIRHHLHEFPHSPGGEVEKMGRKLYAISMTAFFHDVPDSDLAEQYPELYPQRLFALQRALEDETTGPLVIPNLGTIQAVGVDWRRAFDFGMSLTGEAVDLEFVEDQDRDTVFENVDLGRGALDRKNYQLQALVQENKIPGLSVFQAINDVMTAIQAVEGLGDAAAKLMEAKLLQLVELCATADRLASMQLPENHHALRELKALWLTATQAVEDVLARRHPIHTWTVGKLMGVAEVSTAIFGSADHAMDLLQMNPIEDAFAIPAGTVLRYYRV